MSNNVNADGDETRRALAEMMCRMDEVAGQLRSNAIQGDDVKSLIIQVRALIHLCVAASTLFSLRTVLVST